MQSPELWPKHPYHVDRIPGRCPTGTTMLMVGVATSVPKRLGHELRESPDGELP